MKRTSLAVLMIALALVALAAPMAFAQAPAPKVTINGLIDNVTSYSQNISNYNGGVFNRKDSMWYYRTRGRFDFIGEVGKAKGVLGLELDHVFGQAGSNDSTIVNAGAAGHHGGADRLRHGRQLRPQHGLPRHHRDQVAVRRVPGAADPGAHDGPPRRSALRRRWPTTSWPPTPRVTSPA